MPIKLETSWGPLRDYRELLKLDQSVGGEEVWSEPTWKLANDLFLVVAVRSEGKVAGVLVACRVETAKSLYLVTKLAAPEGESRQEIVRELLKSASLAFETNKMAALAGFKPGDKILKGELKAAGFKKAQKHAACFFPEGAIAMIREVKR